MRDGKRPFTNKADREGYQRDLNQMADFLVFRLTHDEVYHPPTATKSGELRPPSIDQTVQSVLGDADRYVLKPTAGSKLSTEQADYIEAFGVAMDAALRKVLPPFTPDYATRPELATIRVNAARMLAVAAQSGASAHAATITQILKDEKTRPEILIYVLQAAENLLAAYSPLKLGDKNWDQHTIPDADLYALVKALETVAAWESAPWMKHDPVAAPAPTPAAAPPAPATPPKVGDKPKAAAPADPKLRRRLPPRLPTRRNRRPRPPRGSWRMCRNPR